MDKWRENGIDSIAIPHNSNGSNGRMFEIHKANGGMPMDTQYLNQRIRNEPIVEITQVKVLLKHILCYLLMMNGLILK